MGTTCTLNKETSHLSRTAADRHPVKQRKTCVIGNQGTSQATPIAEYPPTGGILLEPCEHALAFIKMKFDSYIRCEDLVPVPLTCQSTSIEHMKLDMPVCHDACPE
ncbi:hypothetical protein TNCV_5093201 [Trichonephila clavipes]|nr:hypothetical protein TNCV_5093201 [Trichonephila clavipes]